MIDQRWPTANFFGFFRSGKECSIDQFSRTINISPNSGLWKWLGSGKLSEKPWDCFQQFLVNDKTKEFRKSEFSIQSGEMTFHDSQCFCWSCSDVFLKAGNVSYRYKQYQFSKHAICKYFDEKEMSYFSCSPHISLNWVLKTKMAWEPNFYQ